MTEYSFELTEEDSCLVAKFCGQISTNAYADFRNDYNEICRRLMEVDRKCLVLDLSETKYFSSLFIGIVVKLSVTIRNQGGHLALCGLSDQLKDLMKQLLLLERQTDSVRRLHNFATRPEAIASLTAVRD